MAELLAGLHGCAGSNLSWAFDSSYNDNSAFWSTSGPSTCFLHKGYKEFLTFLLIAYIVSGLRSLFKDCNNERRSR